MGTLFNHESNLRPGQYLSQKFIQGVRAIRRGEQTWIMFGSIDSGTDRGCAPDTVRKILRMVQLPGGEVLSSPLLKDTRSGRLGRPHSPFWGWTGVNMCAKTWILHADEQDVEVRLTSEARQPLQAFIHPPVE